MLKTPVLAMAVAVLGLASTAPARAFEWDAWPFYSNHRYGDDVTRPAVTPERPYWHGDDAVPLAMRWRDQTVYVEPAPPPPDGFGVGAGAAVGGRTAYRHHAVRRHHVARAKRPPVCPPGQAANKGLAQDALR